MEPIDDMRSAEVPVDQQLVDAQLVDAQPVDDTRIDLDAIALDLADIETTLADLASGDHWAPLADSPG